MSDSTEDTTRTVRTIPLPHQSVPIGQRCQHTMRGSKGWRKRGYLNIQVGQWSRPCSNIATGKRKTKWVCSAHGGPKP